MVPDDRQRACLVRATRQGAKLPRLQGHARRAQAAAARERGGARSRHPSARRRLDPGGSAAAGGGSRDPPAVGDGYRQLAATALDAAGDPRTPGRATGRGRVRGDRRRRRAPGRRRSAPGRRRRRQRRRAAARQLRELRRRAARQLPAHSPHRSAPAGRRSREVRAGDALARRPRIGGAPSRTLRTDRAEPAAGGPRARVPARADGQAREDRAARPVPSHAPDVARVRLGSFLSVTRASGRGRGARTP